MFSHLGYNFRNVAANLRVPKVAGDLFQYRRGLREMFPQRIGQRAGAPQEHSAVPEIISRGNEFGRLLRVGLFCEPAHPQRIALRQRFRPRCIHSRFPRGSAGYRALRCLPRRRNLDPAFQSLAISLLVGDHVIGRKHPDDRVGILRAEQKRRQTDRWRGISSHRFGKHLRLAEASEVALQSPAADLRW